MSGINLDDDLIKSIDELNLKKEIKFKKNLEKSVTIDEFIHDKIKPILEEYFKKIENMGCKIVFDADNTLAYKIKYGATIFIIEVTQVLGNDQVDFSLKYHYEGAGLITVKGFTMEKFEENLNKFILDFHKYLLEWT